MKRLSTIGLGLAAAMAICLLPMPYGYYTLLRFVAMIYFACLAYTYFKDNKTTIAVIAASLALLFQPFFKIYLGREIWNIVNVLTAIALIYQWHINRKKND